METATAPTQTRRLPLDVIKFVEDKQLPRETFGEAVRRILLIGALDALKNAAEKS